MRPPDAEEGAVFTLRDALQIGADGFWHLHLAIKLAAKDYPAEIVAIPIRIGRSGGKFVAGLDLPECHADHEIDPASGGDMKVLFEEIQATVRASYEQELRFHEGVSTRVIGFRR